MAETDFICPLLASLKGPSRWCVHESCAWWIKGEERPGGCCIPRLAHYFAGLLKNEGEVLKILRERQEWDRRDQSVHPIGK